MTSTPPRRTNNDKHTLPIIEARAGCDTCKRCDPLHEGLCCQSGSGLAIAEDIPRIARYLGKTDDDTLKEHFFPVQLYGKTLHRPRLIRTGKPYGPCHFFKRERGCSIYPVRPLQCRTGTWSKHSEENHNWFVEHYAVDHQDQKALHEWRRDLRCRSVNND